MPQDAGRLGHAAAWLRAATASLASFAGGIAMRRAPTGEGARMARRLGAAAARLGRTVRDGVALVRDREAGAAPQDGAREADLVEARLIADQWRSRAEACERRVAELEARLGASEMTALDLRSRLVCLHGKLATTAATARYQSLALALEHQPPDEVAAPQRQHA